MLLSFGHDIQMLQSSDQFFVCLFRVRSEGKPRALFPIPWVRYGLPHQEGAALGHKTWSEAR